MGSKAGLASAKAVDRRWLILVPYGAVYLGCTALMGIEQAGRVGEKGVLKVPSIAFEARDRYSHENLSVYSNY